MKLIPNYLHELVRSLRPYVVIVALCLSVIVEIQAMGADSVATVFGNARDTLRRLHTVEFEESFIELGHMQRARFVAKGGKFLLEETLDPTQPGAQPEIVRAFNGERHQSLSVAARHLALSREVQENWPIGAHNVLMLPFKWLERPDHPLTLMEIRERANWDRVEEFASISGERDEDGIHFVEVELKFPKVRAVISFAKEHGYFPMRWETRNLKGVLGSNVRVVNWESRLQDKMPLVMPTRLEYQHRIGGQSPGLSTTIVNVETQSLKINMPVDDDVFTIPHTRADEVVDRDAPNEQPAPPHRKDEAGSPMVLYVALAFVAFAVLAAGLAWYMRRS